MFIGQLLFLSHNLLPILVHLPKFSRNSDGLIEKLRLARQSRRRSSPTRRRTFPMCSKSRDAKSSPWPPSGRS